MYAMTQNAAGVGREQDVRWTEWIKRIAANDLNALAALYDETSDLLFGLVLHVLQDRRIAEETLVDVFHRVRRDAGTFQERERAAGVWLSTIARDVAVERLRSISGERFELFEHRRRLLGLASSGLSKDQHLILQMTYFGGLAAQDVAPLMGCDYQYVTRQIVLAMQKLRDRIDSPLFLAL